jgi:glycyl-tRNA synthetase beta chain
VSGLPLLIEIGCEEVPAGVAPAAVAALRDGLVQTLDAAGIAHGEAVALGTPRRLAVHVADVAQQQPDRTETLTGPPEKAAKDAAGNWTKAAEGFAKGQGVGLGALRIAETPKGPYVALDKHLPGRPTAALLADALPALLRALPLPKRMRWGSEREAFVRPVHWIAALFGDTVVDVAFADVRAGNMVGGHRFWHPQPLGVTSDLSEYTARLRAAKVMVDPVERKTAIRNGIEQLAQEVGGRWNEDEATLDVVSWLVEWPEPLLGRFDDAYLQIPAPVIAATLRGNQKLFTLLDEHGKVLPRFVAVANTLTDASRETVAAGNAKVVSARLSDAKFFVQEDLRTPLVDRRPGLDGRTWLQGAGSVGDKVRRTAAIAKWLAERHVRVDLVRLGRVVELAKCDLETRLVFEFPELQGTVGAEYAQRQGVEKDIAGAIAEHYQPRSASDDLPSGALGAIVGLADRIDTLLVGFALGLQPTGSQDPFGMRRAAVGILRILAAPPWQAPDSLSPAQLVQAAQVVSMHAVQASAGQSSTQVAEAVTLFLRGRLSALHAARYPVDLVDAVLEANSSDVASVGPRLEALDRLRASPDFSPLAVAFKRVANIVRKADSDDLGAAIDPDLMASDAERHLHAAAKSRQAAADPHITAGRWREALAEIAQLKPEVDAFFDAVLVMDPDPAVRRNRLALMRQCEALFHPIADFGRLQG